MEEKLILGNFENKKLEKGNRRQFAAFKTNKKKNFKLKKIFK
jgi:hypothetical protein